jgi:hypothetical protein
MPRVRGIESVSSASRTIEKIGCGGPSYRSPSRANRWGTVSESGSLHRIRSRRMRQPRPSREFSIVRHRAPPCELRSIRCPTFSNASAASRGDVIKNTMHRILSLETSLRISIYVDESWDKTNLDEETLNYEDQTLNVHLMLDD